VKPLLATVALAFFLRHSAHTIDAEYFCLIRQVSNISLHGSEVTHHLVFHGSNQPDASSSVIIIIALQQ
jgi:fumarate reductase subunit C